MNVKYVSRIIAYTLIVSAVFMAMPLCIALYDGQPGNVLSYLFSMMISLICGFVTLWFTRNHSTTMYAQEGFAATGLSWMIISIFGALPFTLSGEIPSYIDALFEIVSGFTTTGSSILTDIEALSRCHLYWRSFSHWLGGMGMLVFLLAVIPQAKKNDGVGIYLMRAESPGPSVGKFTPHLRHTALILYSLYILLTILCIIFLLVGGMPVFDSLCIAFGTAGTGGFGILNDSMASYSPYLQSVVTVFMFLFGINFNLYFLLLLGQFKAVFKNEELKAYLLIFGSSIILITLNIFKSVGSVGEALHHAAFQVSSIMTTTGFATVDFELWPAFSKGILFMLMFVGACAGSTGGGLKVARILLLGKSIKRNTSNALHPRRVSIVRMDGRIVDDQIMSSTTAYLAIYCLLMLLSFMIISIDNYSLGTNISAVVACFNNIGPGFEMVGATGNFSHFSNLSKLVLTADMLLGRLEIFPLLTLITPDLWSRKR
ncbi:MAG: TrkH family potassium uptake protein [Clostridia bacterium]|nr:TrkH family potassium uptake protein [Clostridia bacterium]